MAEKTGSKVAKKASKVLTTSKSKTAKAAAGSALAQARGGKTSKKAAKAASKVMGDKRFSKAARSAAASALTQVEKGGKKKR
jgi:hypothetical protein